MLMSRFVRLCVISSFACAIAGTGVRVSEADDAEKSGETTEVEIRDITLKVPKSWKQEKPSSRLRLAQFQIPAVKDDKEPAELAVFSFGGGGGANDANIRRWIGQFESEERSYEIKRGKSPQGEYVLLDVTGTYQKPVGPPVLRKTEPMPNARMLAVILTVPDKGNYFLKLPGPKKTVDKAAAAFRASFGANASEEKPYKLGG